MPLVPQSLVQRQQETVVQITFLDISQAETFVAEFDEIMQRARAMTGLDSLLHILTRRALVLSRPQRFGETVSFTITTQFLFARGAWENILHLTEPLREPARENPSHPSWHPYPFKPKIVRMELVFEAWGAISAFNLAWQTTGKLQLPRGE